MTYDEAVAYLASLGHETVAIKLGLEKIRQLLIHLGDPQTKFAKVQIAGTNGKGSTAVMLDSICRAAGIRTALFTSPHLINPTERIRIDGQDISTDDFARFATLVRDAGAELVEAGELPSSPTYFEHVTAMFLLAAAASKAELAILETGLGGRLDATTAADAEIVGITPIALDHQEFLGDTLVEIAGEKAAIIRPGVVAVSAPQLPEAAAVIKQRAEDRKVELCWAEGEVDSIAVDGRGHLNVSLTTQGGRYENLRLGLPGRHQLTNLWTAIALAEALRERGWPIDETSVRTGLEKTRHPGRLEWWNGVPFFLFDGAHNPAGAKALAEYLREFVAAPITLVFGAMREKDLSQIEAMLFPLAQSIILCEPDSPRAATVTQLREAAPPGVDTEAIVLAWDVPTALQTALAHTSNEGVICVTGSLYLIGEAQACFESVRPEDLRRRE
ncbi:MAG: folylpolyglutamate synthase/dihydrofolate synthase family protein [Pyrinomonadaceae bacterium]